MRAPVTYREWLWLAKDAYGDDGDWEYASQHYSWQIAFEQGYSPKRAVEDCKEWLYG